MSGHLAETILALAVNAVQADKERKPTSNADGIWRFDEPIFAAIKHLLPADRAELKALYDEVYKLARKLPGGYGNWTPEMIVASYTQTKGTWLIPGFAEARAFNNLYGS